MRTGSKKDKNRVKSHVGRKIVLAVMLFIMSFALFFAAKIFNLDAWHEFDPERILGADKSVIIYDIDGNETAVLSGAENRVCISISDLPPVVRHAFISAEDARFYDHIGIDIIRIAGAAWADIKSGSFDQGASTITQQLIKLSHLTPEKTFSRKIEEAILAYQMEQQYSKDEILEMYLNYVYFGGGFYGIEAASRGYFGIHASELDAAQAAMLAGILKSPTNYAPHLNLEKSCKRRNVILGLMCDYGYLSDAERDAERKKEAVITYSPKRSVENGYYLNAALNEVCELLDISYNDLLCSGYCVYTGLDPRLQAKCEAIVSCADFYPDDDVQGAMVVVNPKNSLVTAIVGGRNTDISGINGFDRATDIRRQPGSVIKPIIAYAPALEYYGYTASTMIVDEPVNYSGYTPKNFNGKYSGAVTLRKAVTSSLNIPAVKVLSDIGVDAGKKFAASVGIEFDSKDDSLALALGGFTYGVSPLQIANAYSVFANGGTYSDASFITEIKDMDGNTLYSRNQKKTRVISEGNAYVLTSMLQSVISEGTGKRLGELNMGLAGKTGTAGETGSEGNRDAWCAAYNVEYSATAWIGYDSAAGGKALPQNATGGTYTALMLKELYSYIYNERSAPKFEMPNSVIMLRMDTYSLKYDSTPAVATPYAPLSETYPEYFVKGTEPANMGKSWTLPVPPTDLNVILSGTAPFITFSASDANTIYKLYREDSYGRVTLMAEFRGVCYAYYRDEETPITLTFSYYVVPVSAVYIKDGAPLEGRASQKITLSK